MRRMAQIICAAALCAIFSGCGTDDGSHNMRCTSSDADVLECPAYDVSLSVTVGTTSYEAKIDQLKFGEPVQLDFTMLQDLDIVSVNIIFGKGTQRTLKVYLEKDATVNKVLVQSTQFSQEVKLWWTCF